MEVVSVETSARNAGFPELIDILRTQRAAQEDVVVPAGKVSFDRGLLRIEDAAVEMDLERGVGTSAKLFQATDIFDGHVAEKLGVPVKYLRRMREEAVQKPEILALLDHNVNAWLRDAGAKKFMVRTFGSPDASQIGIARALLSDRYAPIDNLDVLTAVFSGIREAGVDVQVTRANLSERQMSVSVAAPSITALSDEWLARYRSPFEPRKVGSIVTNEGDPRTVFAGFDVRNSETGGGAYALVPTITVLSCLNGMTSKRDAIRETHLGAVHDEGVIAWSADTMRKSLDLVTARARDAVKTFLSVEFVEGLLSRIEAKAGIPVDEPVETIERVGKHFGFTEVEQASILDCYIKSADTTAGGLVNAVTAAAQVVESPDRATVLEDAGFDVLDYVTA